MFSYLIVDSYLFSVHEHYECKTLSVNFRHARKYFSIYEDNQLEEIQHCMALLAFPPDIREFTYEPFLHLSKYNV